MAPFGSDKFKAIMQCIHGVDNCSNMPETVEKRKQTSLTRRGVECPFQDKIVKDKITSTLQTRYGENVVNPSMIPGNRKKMVENMRAAGKSFGAQNAAYKINFLQNMELTIMRKPKKQNLKFLVGMNIKRMIHSDRQS